MKKKASQIVSQNVIEKVAEWGMESARVVVGIPFHDEDDTLPLVVDTAKKGLRQMGLDRDSLILCVGPSTGDSVLSSVYAKNTSFHDSEVRGFLLDEGFFGRGLCSRAIIAAADKLKAPLILLTPDLAPQPNGDNKPGKGFAPYWIAQLYTAIVDEGHDLALACFNRHYLAHSVESLLAFPIVTGLFGIKLRQPMTQVCSLSSRFLQTIVESDSLWSSHAGTYGFYPWLTISALQKKLNICEVPLGLASFRYGIAKLKLIFAQSAHILLEQTAKTGNWWLNLQGALRHPRVIGTQLDELPSPYFIDKHELFRRFKAEFNHFDDTLFREVLPDSLRERMEDLAGGNLEAELDATEWVNIIQKFLLMYRFERHFHPDDIIDGLFPFFLARLMSIVDNEERLNDAILPERKESPKIQLMIRRELEHGLETHADLMLASRTELIESWRKREMETSSYLPRLGVWEFIPQVGVMVPQVLERSNKETVRAGDVYQRLIDRYREEFMAFISEHLGIEKIEKSEEILARYRDFLMRLEQLIGETVFPFDLSTVDGSQEMTEKVLAAFGAKTSFQLTDKAAGIILQKAKPKYLIMRYNCKDSAGLMDVMSSKEAIGRAAWTDRENFLGDVLEIIAGQAKPDWFARAPLKAMAVDLNEIQNTSEMRGTAALGRLSGRLVVANNFKGRDSEFSKLWYFLKLIKRIIGIELFSDVWEQFAAEERDFGARVVSSIRGHWGRRVLSAHNVFENLHQRLLVERLKNFADDLSRDEKNQKAAKTLMAAASVYHLSITLPDSTFVPLSPWTWASYSFRGGVGSPTPLSSLVERDWATTDFLISYLESTERGNLETIKQSIYALMKQGRESEDLGEHLLGVKTDAEALMVLQARSKAEIPAQKLIRPLKSPILEPISSHSWESKYTLNAAAVRLDGTIYIIYRAFGLDRISRLGLAWTKDGLHIDGRLDNPIFKPAGKEESAGCEDPRVIVIGDEIYMLYTAYDGTTPQIAMASIPIDAFLAKRFDLWKRHGMGFPGLPNKDAVLYPETFDGKWAVYHRIDPNMWLSYIDNLSCPWPRVGQKIVTGPRPGMMWDSVKIGAGAQPIKTKHGWLNIYHGVDYARCYRLGVLMMDLKDPSKVIYQSPNAILEPELDFEVGRKDGKDYWVPHVVFTCGAVPAEDKDILDLDDEILVYYGAADTAIGVAKGRLRDMVPILDDVAE